jgi:hypothetical protein
MFRMGKWKGWGLVFCILLDEEREERETANN